MGRFFLPIRCLLRCTPQSGVSCRFFSLITSLSQDLTKGNKKWTKARLEPLIEWAEETESIYGPVIKSKQKPEKLVEKREKKTAKPKVKKSLEKSSQASSSNNTKEVKDLEILKQTSEFVKDKVEETVVRRKVALTSAAFDDTMDYEEVSDPDVSMSSQATTKFTQKTTTSLGPVKMSHAREIQRVSKNDRQNLNSEADLSLTSAEPEDAIGSVGLKDSEKFVSTSSETIGTGGFLSTILAFPPFTIAWNTTNGRRLIANAAKNSTDLEPGLRDAGFPSVSAILKATMPPESKFFLERWEKEMIEELGEEGFQQYKQELFSNGTNLHLCIQKYLEGQSDIDLKEPNQGHWTSLELVLNDVTDVACTEKPVKHPILRYKGILDCVANYRGKTCIIDWKTSKKPKPNIRQTFDNPVQLAAYLGAYNSQPTLQAEVDSCLLVIGYQDGSPASVHQISRTDCLRYWQTWQRRLHLYWSEYFGRNLNSSN